MFSSESYVVNSAISVNSKEFVRTYFEVYFSRALSVVATLLVDSVRGVRIGVALAWW